MCTVIVMQATSLGLSSPHLLEVRERIRLNGVPLSKSQFVSYFWECYNKLKNAKGLPEVSERVSKKVARGQ